MSGARFVDAPEVRRITDGAVVLGVTASDVEQPPPDSQRVHGLPQARHDRIDVTEADRDHAIDALKRAYVRDELTTDDLGERRRACPYGRDARRAGRGAGGPHRRLTAGRLRPGGSG